MRKFVFAERDGGEAAGDCDDRLKNIWYRHASRRFSMMIVLKE